MNDDRQLKELRQAYRADDFYLSFASDQARRVLEQIIQHPHFPGATDPAVLAYLGALLTIIQPRRVLQLGTYVGFSTVFMADILSRNAQQGHLVTVEPDTSTHQLARMWVNKADTDRFVTFLDGYSTDADINARLQPLGPFDLIYLDSSHIYEATLEELKLIFEHGNWLAESGLLLLHDAAAYAERWDPTGRGGVRRALFEWVHTHYPHYQLLILEPPLWPNACGLGLLTRQPTLPPSVSDPQWRIEELEALIAVKNNHIASLEQTLQQVASGRIMRFLNTVSTIRRAMYHKGK